MSEIALYDALRKIPELSDEEAKEAVADVASSKEVATKSDIERVEARIVGVEARITSLQWVFGLLFVINLGIFIRLFF